MADFRAELQAFVDAAESFADPIKGHRIPWQTALARANAALKQPQGEGLTDEELDELFVEIDGSGVCQSWRPYARAAIAADRARFSRPAVPPADGEVAELVAKLRSAVEHVVCEGGIGWSSVCKTIKRAAELLQQQHPQPVSVSERLPDPRPESEGGDCDAKGRCWLCYTNGCGVTQWILIRMSEILEAPYSHWRPAHALPIPTTTETP